MSVFASIAIDKSQEIILEGQSRAIRKTFYVFAASGSHPACVLGITIQLRNMENVYG